MKKYKMHHSCIRVMDLEKSLEFYQEAFGFKIASKNDFPEGKFTLVFLEDDTGNFALELTYNYDQEEAYTIGNAYSHLAVAVSDVKASYQDHKEKGFQVGDIHKFSEDHAGFYFITDPDGYDIEVIQR
ncbi:lactoylglutathione lyase [Natronospora cellulosivora (SeqCode)]